MWLLNSTTESSLWISFFAIATSFYNAPNNKFQKRKYCHTPSLRETAIEECFVDAFNSLLSRKDEIAENYRVCLKAITDDSKYVKQRDFIDKQCEEIAGLIRELLQRTSRTAENSTEIEEKYDEYVAKHTVLQNEKQELNRQIALCAAKKVQVNGFLRALSKQKNPLSKFDPVAWQATIHYMVVNEDSTVKFVFRDGTELPWTIDPGVRKNKKNNNDDIPLE